MRAEALTTGSFKMKKLSHSFQSLILCLFLSSEGLAQAQIQCGTWSRLTTASSPTQRIRSAVTYLSNQKRALLFGGTGATSSTLLVLGDTWFFDSATKNWQQLEGPLVQPSARYGAGLVFDPVRNVAVLFGGNDANNVPLDDTWEFDGTTWRPLTLASAPSARAFHRLAFDPTLQQIILYGGIAGNTLLQDTWAFNGNQWSKVAEAGPGPRGYYAIGSDSVRGTETLFGGFTTNSFLGDTWELEGTTWNRKATSGPTARIEAPMEFLPSTRRSILFGGVDAAGKKLGDTWSWDGTDWLLEESTGPSARRAASMFYDPLLDSVLLFGGTDDQTNVFNDTWAFTTLDADKNGIGDCSEVPSAATLANITPSRPRLKINRNKIRVKMGVVPGVNYVVTYFEDKRYRKGQKPKIRTAQATRSIIDIGRLTKNKKYRFSYYYQMRTSPAITSKTSPARSIAAKFKTSKRKR